MFQKLNYLTYYDHLQREPNSTSQLVDYSRRIEADEGRQNIRVSDGPVPTIVLRAHQMLHPVSQPSSASPIFLGTASVICYLLHALTKDVKRLRDTRLPVLKPVTGFQNKQPIIKKFHTSQWATSLFGLVFR